MAAYTEIQNELVRQIRKFQQESKKRTLDYGESLYLNQLIDRADSENLIWW